MNDYRAYVENDYNSIYHFGVKGQRWGIRRYQNPDGSLTPEGKKRYLNPDGSLNERGRKELGRRYMKDRRYAGRIAGGALGTAAAAYYAHGRVTAKRNNPAYKAEVERISKLYPDTKVLKRADFIKGDVMKTVKTAEEANALSNEGWKKMSYEMKTARNPMADKLIKEFDTKTIIPLRRKAVAAALAAGIGATAIGLYVHHKGVQKRKAEMEKLLMGSDKSDSSVTKKVKDDWKNLSDKEFKAKYKASKDTYAKRVIKYGDPYMNSPLAKIGKALNKSQRDKNNKKIEALKKSNELINKDERGFTSGAPSMKDIRAQQNRQGHTPSIRETVEKQNSMGRAPSIVPNFITDNFSKAESRAMKLGGDYYVAYDPDRQGYIVRKRGR